MVRKIRDKQYNEIKDKTNEEIIKYFKKNASEMKKSFKQKAGSLT